MLKIFLIFIINTFLIIIAGCGKEFGENRDTATIEFNFGKKIKGHSFQKNYTTDPVDINSINCIGVTVTYPERSTTTGCSITPTTAFIPHEQEGFVPISISGGAINSASPLFMTVDIGTARKFQIVGMTIDNSNLTSCPDVLASHSSIGPYMSPVFVLGEKTQDIGFGSNAVNINISYTGGTTPKISSCTGTLNSWNPFQPTAIADLKAWFDTSDASTLFADTACTSPAADTNTVLCWKDKSGNSLHATTAANGPQYSTANTSLVFNGTTSHLNSNIAPTSQQTIFVVANYAAGASTNVSIIGADSTTNAHVLGFNQSTDTAFSIYRNNLISSGATTNSTKYRMSHIVSGDDQDYYFQGALAGSGSTAGSPPAFNYTIGATNSNGSNLSFYSGQIYEVIVYDRALSTSEQNLVSTYLKNKWNL